MPTRKEVAEKLLKGHDKNEIVAVTIWTREDIIDRTRDLDMTISNEKADEILEGVHHSQSAESGINWAVIDTWIEMGV